MLELVPQHVIPSHWCTRRKAMTKEHISWMAIGRELGRVPHDCYAKHKSIVERQMKKGHFTAEEDALIRQRVEEWGDKGIGLWVALEKEMGRAAKQINKRWLIQRDLNNTLWTDEMVYTYVLILSLFKIYTLLLTTIIAI